MTRRKFAALVLCALFVVFVISTFSLTVVHSHAHCDHDTCPICKTIERTEALLKQLYACFVAVLAAAFVRHITAPVQALGQSFPHPTLVSLKVKLSN